MQRLFRIAILVVCLASFARAQFETSVVLGTVRDPSGNVVPGAVVTLLNTGTGIQATTTTNETGDYQFLNVRIGNYRVKAEKPGFSVASADDLNVAVNVRQRVDIALAVGQVTETVQVTNGVIAAESDPTDRGLVVTSRQVVELPVNGRNYSDLALLSTGVRRSDYAFANPPRECAFNVKGNARYLTTS